MIRKAQLFISVLPIVIFFTSIAFASDNKDISSYYPSKKINVSYNNGATYRIEYLGNNQLRWTGLIGDDKGRSEIETYHSVEIMPDMWMVHWIENDGIVVTQIIQPLKNASDVTIAIPAPVIKADKPLSLVLKGTLKEEK